MVAALIEECLLNVSDEDVSNMGIYVIVSHSGKFYVGQSTNLSKREYEHFRTLRNNDHPNRHLQSSFNKYGSLDFYVIEYHYDPWQLTIREQFWMDYLDSYSNGMNQTPAADSTVGCTRTDETKALLSKIFLEYWGKEENRKAQSERKLKFHRENPNHRLVMSAITKAQLEANPERLKIHAERMRLLHSTPEKKLEFKGRMDEWRRNASPEYITDIFKRVIATKKSKGFEYAEKSRMKTNLTRLLISLKSHDKFVSFRKGKTKTGVPTLEVTVRMHDVNGKQIFKAFSVYKYGLLPAWSMAIKFRDINRNDLIKQYQEILSV